MIGRVVDGWTTVVPRQTATPTWWTRGLKKLPKSKNVTIELLQDVQGLGLKGEVREVRPGYMRNGLLPRRLARYVVGGRRESVVSAGQAGAPNAAPLSKDDQLAASAAPGLIEDMIDTPTTGLKEYPGAQMATIPSPSSSLHNSGRRQIHTWQRRGFGTLRQINQQSGSLGRPTLYPRHVPLNLFEKSMLAVGSAFAALNNPERGDMVAALGETTGEPFLRRLRDIMLRDKDGREVLKKRPVINTSTVSMEWLKSLPRTTFGRTYVDWLDAEGVSPDTREPVRFIDDLELAYVMQRHRECHDFYHTLTGMPTSVEAELALKWFELANARLPVALLSAIFGPLALKGSERIRLFRHYVPWAFRCGSSAKPLICVKWEELWERELEQVKAELGIFSPPHIPEAEAAWLEETNRRRGRSMASPPSPAMQARSFSTSTRARAPSCAVVGAGPAGFYTASRILKYLPESRVDMFEALPAPYGLVRYGVAPDHPEVKNVQHRFEEIAKSDPGPDRFRYFGNVVIGHPPSPTPSPETRNPTNINLSLEVLKAYYDNVILAYGASQDRTLGIPGEDLSGVISARAFVGWYNGLPQYRDLFEMKSPSEAVPPSLDQVEDVVVIGQGNVAIDVARMLLMSTDDLAKTDITEYALEALRKSRVKSVRVVGRRGSLQSAFTVKELREILSIEGVRLNYDFDLLKRHVGEKTSAGRSGLDRFQKRMSQVLEKDGRRQASVVESRRQWSLDYLLSPVQFKQDQSVGKVSRVEFEENKLTPDGQARGLGRFRSCPAQLVLRSVGYRSVPIEGLAFDRVRGLVPNTSGRVINDPAQGGPVDAQLYVTGWLKRGPVGVIGTTMQDAYDVADTIILDWQTKTGKRESPTSGKLDIEDVLKERPGRYVTFDEWKRIEEAEESRQEKREGSPREKYTTVEEMLECLDR